jgi:hypothetical protein
VLGALRFSWQCGLLPNRRHVAPALSGRPRGQAGWASRLPPILKKAKALKVPTCLRKPASPPLSRDHMCVQLCTTAATTAASATSNCRGAGRGRRCSRRRPGPEGRRRPRACSARQTCGRQTRGRQTRRGQTRGGQTREAQAGSCRRAGTRACRRQGQAGAGPGRVALASGVFRN